MSDRSRALGLDIGTRRIGVAVADPTGSFAMPLETVEAQPTEQALVRLAALVQEREVELLVFGWPVEMSGKEGRACVRTQRWIDRITTKLAALDIAQPEVVRWDERLTSAGAESFLIGADVSRSRRKQVVDQIAAAHILTGYLGSPSGSAQGSA